MLQFLKSKNFEPDFPIIDLESNPDSVMAELSRFGPARQCENPEDDIDLSYIVENAGTKISVSFAGDKISYVNYLTNLFNASNRQKSKKLNWFVDYYGGPGEFETPLDTGYMLFMRNPHRKITIVLGLHMGPIRINRD